MPTSSGKESWGPGQTGRGRKRNIPSSGLGDWNEESGEKQENKNMPRTLPGGISSEWGGGLVRLWRILGGGRCLFCVWHFGRSSSQRLRCPSFWGVILEYCLMGQHDLWKEFGFSEWPLGLV